MMPGLKLKKNKKFKKFSAPLVCPTRKLNFSGTRALLGSDCVSVK